LSFPKLSMLLSETTKRKKIILSVFKKLGKEFGANYNTQICDLLLDFNPNHNYWPIQFGFEYTQNTAPRLKVYLSVNSKRFPLKKFCNSFDLDFKLLRPFIAGEKIDAIAIDFLPNNNYFLKIYTISKNKGKLFRLDNQSQIKSVKQYKHFPAGIDVDKRFSFKASKKSINFILGNNFKIHYLCSENGRKSIYLR
ncbi:MAG: hypothetical protein U9R14_03405, partial [Patescibacteria group bacterium]|nr:hypothetical protein [Patescibacteria group bacterium]